MSAIRDNHGSTQKTASSSRSRQLLAWEEWANDLLAALHLAFGWGGGWYIEGYLWRNNLQQLIHQYLHQTL
jgi:hypothetical protein